MSKSHLTASIILFLSAAYASAAPLPWGIALNHQTKECGGFWGGDEHVKYNLPPGWKQYMPQYSAGGGRITTEAGTCDFEVGRAEDCCRQLGYRYVGVNVGAGPSKYTERPVNPISGGGLWLWVLLGFIALTAVSTTFILVLTLFLVFRRRRKTMGDKGT